MAKVALTEQYLEDIADAIRAKNESETLYKPPEMASAILALPAGGGIIPTGTISITTNGTHNVYNYASANVQVSSTINNQNKTVNPSTSQQSITADSGYTGLGTVTVNAMPTLSLPTSTSASATSGYTSKATISRSTSDQYINIGTGYNSAGAYYKVNAVANGTAGTPTATKGAVSSNSVSVTPSVTNTTGYINGGTINGTAVTVSASELVSGNKAITSNGTNIDVANYATVSVNVGGGGTVNNQDKTVTSSGTLQTVTYDSAQGYTGLGTVTINAAPAATIGVADDYEFTTVSGVRKWNDILTPVANETGWITEGWKTPSTIPYNAVPANTVITPTESTQTVGGYLYMMEGAVTVDAIDSEYVGSLVPRVTATDITVSGPTVTMPSGFYSTQLTKTVSSGSATGPSSLSGTSATVSTGTNTLTLTKTNVTTTPTVGAGYVSSATASTATVTLTASVTTKSATTYHPSTTAQSISSGTYLTGAQTIAAVTTSNLSASNIVSGVTIKVGDSSDDDCVASVTGNVVLQNYYTGSSAPSSATGSNGDLYLQS